MDENECPPTPSDSQPQDQDGPHSLPIARVKTIINTVPDVLSTSADGVYALTRATELFIEDLVKGVSDQYGPIFDYDELAAYILENEELQFLHEFFPRRITFDVAMQRKRAKESS